MRSKRGPNRNQRSFPMGHALLSIRLRHHMLPIFCSSSFVRRSYYLGILPVLKRRWPGAFVQNVNEGPSRGPREVFPSLPILQIGCELPHIIAMFPCDAVFDPPQLFDDFVRHLRPCPKRARNSSMQHPSVGSSRLSYDSHCSTVACMRTCPPSRTRMLRSCLSSRAIPTSGVLSAALAEMCLAMPSQSTVTS